MLTGKEVLAQVREALAPYDHHADCLPVTEDNPFGCASQPMALLHRALDGCVLLTREEADSLSEDLTATCRDFHDRHPERWAEDCPVCLLTEEKP